jgi:hypothetical protein
MDAALSLRSVAIHSGRQPECMSMQAPGRQGFYDTPQTRALIGKGPALTRERRQRRDTAGQTRCEAVEGQQPATWIEVPDFWAFCL